MATYLLDTNILLRSANNRDPQSGLVKQAISRLSHQKADLFICSQNIAEYWNTATRPAGQNGYGLTPEQASADVKLLLSRFSLLHDRHAVFEEWLWIVENYSVSGRQVHDARLAAIAAVYNVDYILTLNTADFVRFSPNLPRHPNDI